MRIAIFPGSFDPFTNGHHDVVLRAAGLFDRLIIAIGNNSTKQRYFPVPQMVKIIGELYQGNDKIFVTDYQSLTATFAREVGAGYLVRGLRNTTDFEYENTIAAANRYLYEGPDGGGLETIFLITDPKLAAISSTIIREMLRYGADAAPFVPFALPQ
jgi:pantetheine-phosphate adenylyltransferase